MKYIASLPGGSKFFPLREAPILEAILGSIQDFPWVCVKITPLYLPTWWYIWREVVEWQTV